MFSGLLCCFAVGILIHQNYLLFFFLGHQITSYGNANNCVIEASPFNDSYYDIRVSRNVPIGFVR